MKDWNVYNSYHIHGNNQSPEQALCWKEKSQQTVRPSNDVYNQKIPTPIAFSSPLWIRRRRRTAAAAVKTNKRRRENEMHQFSQNVSEFRVTSTTHNLNRAQTPTVWMQKYCRIAFWSVLVFSMKFYPNEWEKESWKTHVNAEVWLNLASNCTEKKLDFSWLVPMTMAAAMVAPNARTLSRRKQTLLVLSMFECQCCIIGELKFWNLVTQEAYNEVLIIVLGKGRCGVVDLYLYSCVFSSTVFRPPPSCVEGFLQD